MLAYNFDYYLPDTLKEAADIYDSFSKSGKTPLYYGGGTEIISMARVNNLRPDAVIDIKKIPECMGMGADGARLFFGAAATLNDIHECGLYPLLGLAGSRIADHTIQCKLTLGGNLAGTICYHETLLPLLLADGTIAIQDEAGLREVPIGDVMALNKGLKQGELIVMVSLDKRYAELPHAHIKKSRIEKIGYPLVSLCAVNDGGMMRAAASGLCRYPFRFRDIRIDNPESASEIAEQMAGEVPAPLLEDPAGSAKYRDFILKKTLENIVGGFRSH